jgi:hypothetical protein
MRLSLATLGLAIGLALAGGTAQAGSQSSNSSSNCSDGHCTRIESYREREGGRRWGWTRESAWREVPPWHRGWHNDRRRHGWEGHGHRRDGWRGRERDDDD